MDAEPTVLHRQMLELVRAGDRAGALDAAERLLEQVEASDEPGLQALTARTTATWLSLKAYLAPAEALTSCDAVFARFSDAAGVESPATAAAALRVKIGLLLRAGRREEAVTTVGRLARYIDSEVDAARRLGPLQQLVATAGEWVHSGENQLVIGLMRAATRHLAGSEEGPWQVTAAVAQLWLVIGLMYSEAADGIGIEASTFQEMGSPALTACDELIRQCSKGSFWRQALMVVISLKIETLDWLGRSDETTPIKRAFIKLYDGTDFAGVQSVVDDYRSEIG